MRADHSNPGGSPKVLLASLMALLCLATALISASHALHQSLHSGSADHHVFCLACAIAKAQLTAAQVALAPVLAVFVFIGTRFRSLPALRAVRHLPFQSRGPPRSRAHSR